MVSSCVCGSSQPSTAWPETQAFLGTRSWSKRSPHRPHCTCRGSNPDTYQSVDKSSDSSLESLPVTAEDNIETGTSEDAVRSPLGGMGASALEKRGRGGDRRGTKRLRSALANGNGPVGVEGVPKKQANGLAEHNGGIVSAEPLGGAEQKEAKLGRSFSDATMASMPLKKRKLQLMMAMMEEEAEGAPPLPGPERSPQGAVQSKVLENGHALKAETDLDLEDKDAAAVGVVEVQGKEDSRLQEEDSKFAGPAEDSEGLASVALDVLAGVAASAEAEMRGTGSPILKAPVKGKRNGGRRARFGGERGNSSRENSADEKSGGPVAGEGEAEGVKLAEGRGAGIGEDVERLLIKDIGRKESGKETAEVREAANGREGRSEEESAQSEEGSLVEVQEIEVQEIKQEQELQVEKEESEPKDVPSLSVQEGPEEAAHGQREEQRVETLKVDGNHRMGKAEELAGEMAVPASAGPDVSAQITEGDSEKVSGPLLHGVESAADGDVKGSDAVLENGVLEARAAEQTEGPISGLASVPNGAPRWDGDGEELADGNLSPVSEDGGVRWGAGEGEKREKHAVEAGAERLQEEAKDSAVQSDANAKSEAKAGVFWETDGEEQGPRSWSAGSRQEPVHKATEADIRLTSAELQAGEPEGTGAEPRLDSCGENLELETEQVDVDYGASSEEDEGLARPTESDTPQTTLAAAVSSAVAAAQGAPDNARQKEGGRAEDDAPGGEKSQELRAGRGPDSARGLDSRGLDSRGSDAGRGSGSGRSGDSGRGSDAGPPPPARRDARRFGAGREGSRERQREEADRWQDLERRDERPGAYRREFSSRGIPGAAPGFQGWGPAPPYGAKGWSPGVRRSPGFGGPSSLNAAAAAAARLQSTGFVVNPDGTISKVPEPMMGPRGGGMYAGGGLRRIGGAGGVPRAVLAYSGMGGPPGLGGLMGPVTRPVMLVPGRGLVEVPYPGPRPMMGGPPPRYPPGWRRGRSPSPPPPARPPPPRGSYHGASPARGGRSRSRSRSPPPPRNRDYHPGFRGFERNGSRGRPDMRDPSPPPPRTRTPPAKGGESLSPPGSRGSPLPHRRNGGSSQGSEFGSGGRNGQRVTSPVKRSVSPARKRGGSDSRDDSRSPPVRRRDVSGSPINNRTPPKSRRDEKGEGRERDGQLRREDTGRGREREGSYNRERAGEQRPGKDRSSRRNDSPPPRRRVVANGSGGSALADEEDRFS